MLRRLKSSPMFFALPDRPSFVDMAINAGREFLMCALYAIVTDVSVMPWAIFESVQPVHGAIISRSSSFLGPIGSASFTVFIISFPVMRFTVSHSSRALPKRVSVEYTMLLIIGTMSAPMSASVCISRTARFMVQNDLRTC